MAIPHVTTTAKNISKSLPRLLGASHILFLILFLSTFTVCAEEVAIATAAADKRPTERHRLAFFTGAAQIFKSDIDAVFGIEFYPKWRWHGFGSWASLCVGDETGLYASAGILYPFLLGEKWRLTPKFGFGYFKDHKFELGSELEFRSGIELSREFQRGYRIGVSLAHISNASIGDVNPGTEAICVSVSLPIF